MTVKAPIVIIGAGPSGLTLARLLEINNFDYVVYERDISPEPKFINQGGTLDIHSSSGQQALKEANLFDEFKNIARWEASRVCMQNPSGTVEAVFGEDRDAPEIDRLHLRKMLLDSIPPHKIRWGHGVKSIDGGTSAFDHLTSAKPEYSGKVFIEGSISCDNPSYAAALEHAGVGAMLAMGDGKMFALQQLSDRSYRFYMGMDAPEDIYRKQPDPDDTETMRQKFLSSPQFFANWAPHLKEYLANAEGPFHAWPLYRLPVSSVNWERVPGVTLLGDAAHLSTPLVGEGVNHAMFDALMLAKTIVKHCNPGDNDERRLETALKEYETEMFERGQDHISRCMAREMEFFSENAAEDFISMINAAMEEGKKEALKQ
ncbi:hypothetical protein F53441_1396 [Fusarium austroafricanum]|uniref:FAD-binding domain-containing protein n=1 Tax=Fusarium austroafricanum TaxID=2364996 RepID=A0A8H4KUK8_9HYPO|nr:hypothetical protein F53441_1396 [Fusarium austroafricanum]